MLYIGIPAYNEATTIGVLLWRLRSVLAEVSREYEVVVYDDASTDQTAETLAPYTRVLPLTVIRGTQRLGYAGATDALVRHVARTTRYPRRDALLLLQGDFTDPPALVPEFLRRFEGGADLVIGERVSSGDAPKAVRRLWQAARWVLRPFVGISDVRDLTTSFRLVRIAVLRDLIKAAGDAPIVSGEAWSANADFLLRTAPHARRVETIPVTPTFTVRTRESRRAAWPDAIALAKWGWSRRGERVAAKVIARAVDAVEAEEPSPPEVVDRMPRERPPREKAPREKPNRERQPREREPREREPRERASQQRDDGVTSVPLAAAPAASAAVSDPSLALGAARNAAPATDPDATLESSPADGSLSARPARKRRKRGARRDRSAQTNGGDGSDEREDLHGDVDARAHHAGSAPGDSRGAPGETTDFTGAAGDATGEATGDAAGEAVGDAAGEAVGDAAGEATGEAAGDATPRRKRSRRGRRRRSDTGAPNGLESTEGEGESPDLDPGEAQAPSTRRSRAGRTERTDRSAPADEGEDRSSDDRGSDADDDRSPATNGDDAARKRRRSRRGRRGGSRKRANGSPGEGEPNGADANVGGREDHAGGGASEGA